MNYGLLFTLVYVLYRALKSWALQFGSHSSVASRSHVWVPGCCIFEVVIQCSDTFPRRLKGCHQGFGRIYRPAKCTGAIEQVFEHVIVVP
jgi:hypothetical protein